MKLITCPDCGADVSKKAVACPGCGSPYPGNARLRRGNQKNGCLANLFALIFIVIALPVACSYMLGGPSSSEPKKPVANKSHEEIKQERLEQERENILKEADRKLRAEERLKKDIAERDAFLALLQGVESADMLISSVSARNGKATIEVKNLWHIRNYQIRLQDAQSLEKLWSNISSPDEAGTEWINIVDLNGNKVGGSGILGVWVQEQ